MLMPTCPLFSANLYIIINFLSHLITQKKWAKWALCLETLDFTGFFMPTFAKKSGLKVGKVGIKVGKNGLISQKSPRKNTLKNRKNHFKVGKSPLLKQKVGIEKRFNFAKFVTKL